MVERTNGSPWFFIVGAALVLAGLVGPLIAEAYLTGLQWLALALGAIVAIAGGIVIGIGVRRRHGR